MESTTALRSPLNPRFALSPEQEKLLLAALYSNTSVPAVYDTAAAQTTTKANSSANVINSSTTDSSTINPNAMSSNSLESPLQATPASATAQGFEESPFIDYDYDFEADGLDFGFANDATSQGQMIGSLPGTSSDGDQDNQEANSDKRSHPGGDDGEEGGGKRREGEEKASKKPGRKPLTSEPTSKRKAQNRAAQRAFRERKEKHLKDLETKVEDLQKASESANHENSILRAQIEKMSAELREYKKRLSLATTASRPVGAYQSYGRGASSINDVNFQFEFPTFGKLPTPQSFKTLQSPSSSTSSSLTQPSRTASNDRNSASPRNQSMQQSSSPSLSNKGNSNSPANNGNYNTSNAGLNQTIGQSDTTDMSSFSGLFSPSLLESVSKSQSSPFDFFNAKDSYTSRSSLDSGSGTGTGTGHASTSHSSPSASSNSAHGASSSCGTSPEPTSQSPNYSKALDNTLTTIGEESTKGATNSPDSILATPKYDLNGIDFFAAQNGNQFDPQLFGDYREPQDSVLANGAFNDSFFSEAYNFNGSDFTSPYNAVASPKKDLVSQIDQAQANDEEEVVPGEDTTKMLTCNTIWDRLQACPKVKEGEFDLDGLCKDLQKKAKCSETGAVVNESDFHKVLENYVGHKVDSQSIETMVKNS